MADEEQIDGVTHAEKDANGDIVHNPDVVNTEGVAIDGVSEGATTTTFTTTTDQDTAGGEFKTQVTDGVGTSENVILDMTPPETNSALLVVVSGDERGSTNRFSDILNAQRVEDPQVIDALPSESPAGRTYSRNGEDILLAMDSGTYDVVAEAIVARRVNNATS